GARGGGLRHRGGERDRVGQDGPVRAPERDLSDGGDPRFQHLLDLDHPPGDGERPARARDRDAFHESARGHEAGRDRPRPRHERGDLPRGADPRGAAREDDHARGGLARLHREPGPPAHDQRGDLRGLRRRRPGGGRRYGDEARDEPAHGAARARRLDRARHLPRDHGSNAPRARRRQVSALPAPQEVRGRGLPRPKERARLLRLPQRRARRTRTEREPAVDLGRWLRIAVPALVIGAAGAFAVARSVITIPGSGECPPGTVHAGKGPPDGDAVWCEEPEGHVKHGPYHEWMVTGVKVAEGRYEHGKKQGLWTTYWWNGAKWEQGPYRDGVREGPWKSWYDTGEVADAGEYHANKPEGHWVGWHRNGRKADEGDFHEGMTEGPWIGWHENGQKSQEGAFRRDQPHGHFVWWYPNGRKQMEGDYLDGMKVGRWIEWDESGHKTSEKTYREGVEAKPSDSL